MMIRIKWSVEEMVAMVALYYKYKNDENIDLENEYVLLSRQLVKRADILSIQHDSKYRNINGMRTIFENVKYVDTNGENGLSGASQLVYEVVKLYNDKPFVFNMILTEFNEKYKI